MTTVEHRKLGPSLRKDMETIALSEKTVAFWHLGQSGVVIKAPGAGSLDACVAVDPYLTNSIERNEPGTEFVRAFAPPMHPEDLAGIMAVLVSHQHNDHLDLETLTRLHAVSANTKFIVPAPHVHLLTSAGIHEQAIIRALAGQEIRLSNAAVLPIAAAHTDYGVDADGNHLYLGYVLDVGEVKVYHSGDTIVTDALVHALSLARPDVALLPINGVDYARTARGIVGNMSARDAVDLAHRTGIDMLLPNHYDMFPNNRDNPAFFVDYLFAHYPDQKFHMMAVGERFVYFGNIKT